MCIGLVGCASPKNYVRVDGKAIPGNPQLEQQRTVDRTICEGEKEKTMLVARNNDSFGAQARASDVLDGCMAQKGYLNQPPSQ